MEISEIKIDTKSIACFVSVFLIVFGPRVAGVIDLSVLTSVFLLLFFMNSGKIYNYVKGLAVVLFLIIIYTIVVSIFSDEGVSLLFLLKFIRVLLALSCISNYIESDVVKPEVVRNALTNVLLLHAGTIIVGSLIWPEFQNILKPINGFALPPNFFRSTGLTNGYDFAGLLCLFGALIVSFDKEEKCKSIKTLVFVASAILTSRVNMILAELLILLLLFTHNEQKKIFKLLLLLLFLISLFPVFGIFLFTTQNQNNFVVQILMQNDFFSNVSTKLVYYYATSDVNNSLTTYYNFDSLTNAQFWFGAMKDTILDPGYTQYIYHIGAVGLFVSLFFYVEIVVNAVKMKYVCNHGSFIIICMCIACVLLSVKNSYFLARHVTEILLIVYSLTNKEYRMRINQIEKR